MQQQSACSSVAGTDPPQEEVEAPPKQVAMAMERLGQAARLIADIRLGADRFLEALLSTSDPRSSDPEKPLRLISIADSSMRRHLEDLRTLGRQLEESGVLNQSLRSRSDHWGLHMPLVCPDTSVVAYAWKRQLAGQAGASAVDRARVALRAFTEQKKRFFPHLDDEMGGLHPITEPEISKRSCYTHVAADSQRENLNDLKTLSDVLSTFEKESPNLKIFTYQRLEWLKRAASLAPSGVSSIDNVREHTHGKPRSGPLGSTTMNQVAIIELFVPFVFRAVLSLHPAGSVNPSSVAFFSPDEGGNYIHSKGSSVFHVYKHITDHAEKALQYFQSAKGDRALYLLLHWIYGYHNLFTKVCSKCKRLITMDKSLNLLLPPLYHPYMQASTKLSSDQPMISNKELFFDQNTVYHFQCTSEES